MGKDEFSIGLEFWSGDRQFRCTDVGSRTIVAIRVDSTEITIYQAGRSSTRALGRAEAEASGVFSGPPYGVAEIVFDEDDLEGCSLARDDRPFE